MKKHLILGGFISLAAMAHAQWAATSAPATTSPIRIGGSSTTINETLHIGDGAGSLHFNTNGILVKFSSATSDRALLEMHDPSGVNRFVFQALSSGTYFSDYTGTLPLFLQTSGGKVSVGNVNPLNALDVTAQSANDGIRISQAGTGSGALNIANTNTGGNNWSLRSTGSADAVGAGHLLFYDNNAATARMLIKNNGAVSIGSTTPPFSKFYVIGDGTGIRGDATTVSGAAYAVTGIASGSSGSAQQAIGVTGTGSGSIQNFGGFFTGVGTAGPAFGVYGRVTNPNPGDWAGYFNGDVNIQGQAFCTASAWSSDRKLKSEIRPFMNAMDKIALLKPSTYLFKTEEFKDMNLPKGNQIGLIAQELEEVFPELVSKIAATRINDQDGNVTIIEEHKAVNYIGLIPVLISGLQEQQKINTYLLAKVADLQKQMSEMTGGKTGAATGINVSNTTPTDGFALDQNVPNPFSNETTIKYTLPANYKNAALTVYDLSGKQITSFPLTEKGAVSISITSEKLAAGIYIYSVIADGKILDSKRMVVAEKQ